MNLIMGWIDWKITETSESIKESNKKLKQYSWLLI